MYSLQFRASLRIVSSASAYNSVFTFPHSLTSSLIQTYKQYGTSRMASSSSSYTTNYASATTNNLLSRCSLSDPTAHDQYNHDHGHGHAHTCSSFISQHPADRLHPNDSEHKHKRPDNPHHSLPNSTGSTARHSDFPRAFHYGINNNHSNRKPVARALPECSTGLAAHPRDLLALVAGDGLGRDVCADSRFIPRKSRLVGSKDREAERLDEEGSVCQQDDAT
jgi:hypothetical protein